MGPLPETVAESHAASSLTLGMASVPVPVLLTVSVCAAGLTPTTVANESVPAGATCIAGWSTVNVTGYDRGELSAPAEVIVMVPV